MLEAMLTSLVLAAALQPAKAEKFMVSSPEPLATQIGVRILEKGGNAFDAAAAVGFAIAVTFPEAGNLGGGGFAVGLTGKGERFALDFREVAPAGAKRDMYVGEDGAVIDGLSTDTHLAVGVPGSVDGLLELQAKYGKLKRADIVEPAERLARDGFVVREYMSNGLKASRRDFERYESSMKLFFPGGEVVKPGVMFKIPELANTLKLVREKGRDGFYEGVVADAMERDMVANGGILRKIDLRNYHAKWRKPIVFWADGVEGVTMPLPSSGGITLAQTFAFLDWDYLRGQNQNSVGAVHHLTEALRLSYADRNAYLGDSDFASVPAEQMLNPEYLAKRRRQMVRGIAGKSTDIGAGLPEKMETTHYCVVDGEGNVCAVTTTLNGGFGIGAVVPGAGFIWNNEMDDFTSQPGTPNRYGLIQGEANAVGPGKKMLSSMTPTIFLQDGKFWMTVGSPGGPTIITTVLQTFLNSRLWGMNIREAIDAPRFHHQHFPDDIRMEPGFDAAVYTGLEGMGYALDKRTTKWGQAAGIMRMPDGSLTGWFDSRGDGLAAGK